MPEPQHTRKHIVIIGGGFAGLAAALELEKLRRQDDTYNVTLIDKNCYHVYHALLYEVATASMDIDPARLDELERGVCVRIKALENIFLKKSIHVVQAVVTAIDQPRCQVFLGGDPPISYDYLLMALGSMPNYFHIPGLEEHSTAFKELPDALRVHVQLQELLTRADQKTGPLHVVVGGGGVSGVEVAAELSHYLHRWERGQSERPVSVEILEASPTILAGLDPWVQQTAQRRLERLGVHCGVNQLIVEVNDREVRTKDGAIHPYDLLLWCGGIMAHPLYRSFGAVVNPKGQIPASPTLNIPGSDRIFIAGDGLAFTDQETHTVVPQIAPAAIDQGQLVANNIFRHLHQQPMLEYHPRPHGYVIPVGGRWAVSTLGGHYSGWWAWVQRKMVDLRYFLSILRWPQALQVWWSGGKVYLRND